MSGEARKSGKAQLALALARGVPIAKWARASGVPVPTAFRWAREPEVRKVVEDHRRRTIDEAVGEMSKHFGEAAAIIWHTAKEGDSGIAPIQGGAGDFHGHDHGFQVFGAGIAHGRA